jgi:hypothetical protein
MTYEVVQFVEPDERRFRQSQAQAMLDLFEADCGRAATTLDEVKKWADAQDNDLLQCRVDRLVFDRLAAAEPAGVIP